MRLVKGLAIHGACTTIRALQWMFRNVVIMCSMHTEYVPSYFGHHVKITRNLYAESMMGLGTKVWS